MFVDVVVVAAGVVVDGGDVSDGGGADVGGGVVAVLVLMML